MLTDADGVEIAVTVVDLSSGGFRVWTVERLVAGEPVRLTVRPGDHLPAEIRWASANEAGGRFLNPVRLDNGTPTRVCEGRRKHG